MKKFLCVLLAGLILAGCSNGVSQEEYDKLKAENESLKSSISSESASSENSSSSKETVEYETYQTENCVYRIPKEWIYEKSDKSNANSYFSSPSNNHFYIRELNSDAIASQGMEELGIFMGIHLSNLGFSISSREVVQLSNTEACKIIAENSENSETINSYMYVIRDHDFVFSFIFEWTENDESKKFLEHMEKVVNSIMFVDHILPNRSDASEAPTDLDTQTKPSESPVNAEENEIPPEDFVKTVKLAIRNDIGEGESISDIKLENSDLCIYVDLGGNDTILAMKDIAFSRTSSITDSILELYQYDHLWDSITVDFGKLGKIVNKKDNIESNEYGRYFKSSSFKLE